MVQSPSALPGLTLTAAKRKRFPGRYARKDARTLVLRLVYGVPVRMTDGIVQRSPAGTREERDFIPLRRSVEEALPLTGYDPARCRQILTDLDRLRLA